MSLQVWLPLTGHLNNQGLSDVTVTNNGATVDNNGKIGKCYSFSRSSTQYIKETEYANLGDTFTIALWLNCTTISSNSGIILCSRSAVYSGIMIWQTNGQLFIDPAAASYSLSTRWDTNFSFSSNTWYHLTVIRTPDTISYYINGEFKQSKNIAYADGYGNTLSIGCRNTNGDTYADYFVGKMNDIRIYDHALSAKEVKELSKGLVLHYPLSRNGLGNDNILTNSTGYQGTTGWSGAISVGTENGRPYFITKRTNTSISTREFIQHTTITSLVSGWTPGTTKFTVSGYYKIPSSETYNVAANLFIRWTYQSGQANYTDSPNFVTPTGVNVVKDKWIRFELVSTVPSSYVNGSVSFNLAAFSTGVSTVYWKDVKIEIGDKATPWIPAVTDTLYTQLNMGEAVEYDVSGYNNHGTKWAYNTEGSIESSSETPRYNVCTFINSANSSSSTANGMQYIYGDIELTNPNYLTVAFWLKPLGGYQGQLGQGQFCFTNLAIGINTATDYQTTPMHNRDSDIDFCNSAGTHKTMSFSPTSGWHHYAVIYDGRYGKIYKDAVYQTSVDMGSEAALASCKAIVIGFSKAGNVYRKNRSYFSDFRIYATALSAEDIAELYNTAASLANNGTLFAYDFVEV